MKRKGKKTVAIPDEVIQQMEAKVERFNRTNLKKSDCYYEAQYRGSYCYLYRNDYGRMAPICRLTYTGDINKWRFAIFKWSSETYDPTEWMFPGIGLFDGTVEGAMKAGMEAYPA